VGVTTFTWIDQVRSHHSVSERANDLYTDISEHLQIKKEFESQLVSVSLLAILMAILYGSMAWLWLHIQTSWHLNRLKQLLLFVILTCLLPLLLSTVASSFLHRDGLLETDDLERWIAASTRRDTLDIWLSYPFFISCLLPLVRRFLDQHTSDGRPKRDVLLPRPAGTGVLLVLCLFPALAWTLHHPILLQGPSLYLSSLPVLALTMVYGFPGAAASLYTLYTLLYPGTVDLKAFFITDQDIFFLSTAVAVYGLASVLEDQRQTVYQRLQEEEQKSRVLQKSLQHSEQTRQQMRNLHQSIEGLILRCSHEMRTPLTPILLWAQMLRESSSRKTLFEASHAIEQNIERQTRLLDELNDTIRLCSGKLKMNIETIEITGLLEQTLDQVRPFADQKAVRILTSPESAPDYITGDREQLFSALLKILDHVIRFGQRGSSVSILFSRQHRELLLHIKHSGYSPDHKNVLEILRADASPDEDRFLTAANFDPGIYVAKKLIEMQDGHLTAASLQPKPGMLFSLTLRKALVTRVPISTAPAGETPSVPMATGVPLTLLPSAWQNRHLLIVEDDPFTLQLLSQLLRNEGLQTIGCSTSTAALEAFHRWQPPVVIADLGLPDINGYELIKRMKKSAKQTFTAIAFSASVSPDAHNKALQAGFSAFLAKPLQTRELRRALDQLLTQHGLGSHTQQA